MLIFVPSAWSKEVITIDIAGIMAIRKTVVLRAILAGGFAAFSKIGTVMKDAGGMKVGVTAAAVTTATTAAVSEVK